MRPFFIFLLGLITLQSSAQLIIKNTTVVDVVSKKLLPGQDVVVEGDRITAIGKGLKAPAAAQVIDGRGKWLMPGLVDGHVHFFQSGGLYARPDAIDLRKVKDYKTEIEWTHNNMERFLRRYIRAGITSVIDVGATIRFLQQRDSFRTKEYAPSIYMTGPLLTTWEPDVYKGLGNDEPFYLMKTPAEARAWVQKQLPYKPDFIKIWYIVLGKNKDSAARASQPLIAAAIQEAHGAGLKVAVHATERISATLAVQAGADFLVHGVEDGPVDKAFIQLLKQKGVVLSPTLVVAGNYNKYFGQTYMPTAADYRYAHPAPLTTAFDLFALKDTNLTKAYKAYTVRMETTLRSEDSLRAANLKALFQGGVTITTGTDAGNIGTHHVSSYYDELAAMQASGLSTWDLLEASTINGAKALGKEAEFGSIKRGLRADMLLLTKDPTQGFANWQSIEWVVNKGIALQPDSILVPTPEELADEQLTAYNAHNLEAFLRPYAEDVEIYNLNDGKLMAKGKEAMRKQYTFLTTVKELHCKLLNRMVQGNMVIDHEEITGTGGRKFYGLAIYETKGGKISKVWFPE